MFSDDQTKYFERAEQHQISRHWNTTKLSMLGHLSEEGNVTQHMQGTLLMPRYYKC